MEAKSEEYAAYRFHLKLRRMHRKAWLWNIENGSWAIAWYHVLCYSVEIVAVEFHKKHLRQTIWWEKVRHT